MADKEIWATRPSSLDNGKNTMQVQTDLCNLSYGSSSPFYIGIFHKYVQATHLFRSIDVNPIYD